MDAKAIKFIKGSLFFIITLAILFSIQHLWFNYSIKEPLTKELNNIPEVEKAVLEKKYKLGEPINISVTLAEVTNFHKTYTEINEKILRFLGKKPYELLILDNRTDELRELYYDIHYYIEKALIDGNFPMLVDKASEIAKEKNAEAKIYVDKQNMYLHLCKNDNSLYMLISRH